MRTIDGLRRTKYLRGRGGNHYNFNRWGRNPAHPLPASCWGIVQWQDSGLWRRRWRFDPSSPSQPPTVKSGTPGKAPGVFHFFNLRTIRRAIRQNHPGVRPPAPASGWLMMKIGQFLTRRPSFCKADTSDYGPWPFFSLTAGINCIYIVDNNIRVPI